MAYIGAKPNTVFRRAPTKDSFTGDGSTTTFDLANIVPAGGENALQVFIDNVRQEPGSGKAYTLGNDGSGDLKRITFSAAPASSAAIYVITSFSNEAFAKQTDLKGSELALDADGDTTITADTDDQIDIKIAGADDFQFTANTFTAQSGSTIAAQALTATTITASGIVKTDDTTEATSTTDGSLQTDGGLSVAKDAVLGDDLKLLSDSAVLSFGADSDTTLTHTDGTGLTLNSTNKLLFGDTGTYIHQSADGVLDLVSDTEIEINATTIDINGAVAMDGAITGATNITLSGELDAATLDISGNADIDGTTNLDAVDIDGAVQLDSTFTVGVDDTGYDVKFFGATSGSYMLWDESTDDLILAGAAKLYLYDAGGGEYISSSGSALTIASGGTAWELPTSDGSANQLLKTDGSGNLDWTTVSGTITALNNQSANRLTTIGSTTTELDGEANLTFTGSALTCIGTITVGVDDTGHDVKFFGATSGKYLEWDESADQLDVTGSLDVTGNTSMVGTLSVGVDDTGHDVKFFGDTASRYWLWDTSADGVVQRGTLTVGVDDTGHDVKFFGATASAYMEWDESEDDLILGGAARIVVPEGQLVLGSTAVSSTAAELNLLDGVSGLVQADFTKLAAVNSTDSELNLLDGSAKSTSSITLADSDAIIVIDGTTTKQIPVSDIKTYNPGGTAWQAVVTGNTTMTAGRGYFVNTTSAAITMTLPAGTIGDEISIIDYAGTFDSNNLTVAANGSEKIHGSTDDLTVATERAAFTLVYTDSTQGWLLINN